jgi:hypothetical protein
MNELTGFEIGLLAANSLILIIFLLHPFFVRRYLRRGAQGTAGEANGLAFLGCLWVLFIFVTNAELVAARLVTGERSLTQLATMWLVGNLFLFFVLVGHLRRRGRLSPGVLRSGLTVALIAAFLFVAPFFGYYKPLWALVALFALIAIVYYLVYFFAFRQRKDPAQKSR